MRLLFVFFAVFLFAKDKLVIDAKHFESDDKRGIIVFDGNVKMKKAKDSFFSDRLEVLFKIINNKRKIIKYVATGNVRFEIFGENKHYKGKGEIVVYEPTIKKYKITGNGYVEDFITKRKLIGEVIYIDMQKGEANVEGSKIKPVRFEMTLEEVK